MHWPSVLWKSMHPIPMMLYISSFSHFSADAKSHAVKESLIYTHNHSKQIHSHMQKVTGEVQPQPVWPLTHTVQAQEKVHSTGSEPDTAAIAGNMLILKHQRTLMPRVGSIHPTCVRLRCVAAMLTFRWHPVFVWTAGQAPVVGIQARYVTCAVTARRRTPAFLLVRTRSICEQKVTHYPADWFQSPNRLSLRMNKE